MIYKKLIPASLLGRSLIIVFIPIITLVILTTFVFYQTSWNIISKRLTQSVVADINVIIKLIDQNLTEKAITIGREDFKMHIQYKKNESLNPSSFHSKRGILSKRLQQALEELNKPFFYDLRDLDQGAQIIIQIKNNLLIIKVDKEKSSSFYSTSGGYADFNNNKLLLLLETIESIDQIDKIRAKSALDRAKERLRLNKGDESRAKAALIRAQNRLKIISK